jgi:hypothetical protein
MTSALAFASAAPPLMKLGSSEVESSDAPALELPAADAAEVEAAVLEAVEAAVLEAVEAAEVVEPPVDPAWAEWFDEPPHAVMVIRTAAAATTGASRAISIVVCPSWIGASGITVLEQLTFTSDTCSDGLSL